MPECRKKPYPAWLLPSASQRTNAATITGSSNAFSPSSTTDTCRSLHCTERPNQQPCRLVAHVPMG
jgi:hypothetical protein